MEINYKIIILNVVLVLSLIIGLVIGDALPINSNIDYDYAEYVIINFDEHYGSKYRSVARTIELTINENMTIKELKDLYAEHPLAGKALLKLELNKICG